jgi:hypothetical protein
MAEKVSKQSQRWHSRHGPVDSVFVERYVLRAGEALGLRR